MDHVVIPLDADHVAAVDALADAVAAAAGVHRPAGGRPHVTLAAFTGVDRCVVQSSVAAAVAATAPFVVHAHGYGFFAGDEAGSLNLHVPVVRNDPLAGLHRVVLAAIRHCGGTVAGWTEPEAWTPHITLLDRELDPARLGAAVSWLAAHHHPSWQIGVVSVAVTGGWEERWLPAPALFLAAEAQRRPGTGPRSRF